MKLIRCKKCNDVVRLIHTEWRKCYCGKSGGQYNDDLLSATVGGTCEVIGIRNDFFETPKRKRGNGILNILILGEYVGDDPNLKKISRKISRSLTNYNLTLNELKKIDTRVSIGLVKRIYHEYSNKIDGYPLPFKTYVHNIISYYYKKWLDEQNAKTPNKLRNKK